jgi:predicted enzyme related to lactoylglutathione lyase
MNPELIKLHGAFSWNELLTTDVAGAKRFYGELLGWTLQDTNEHGVDYTLAKVGETPMGGIMAIPPGAQGMPPTWGIYVTVDDVDQLLPKVAQLGGSVCVPPQDIPGLGRFAVIQDPQGARLTLITYTCLTQV